MTPSIFVSCSHLKKLLERPLDELNQPAQGALIKGTVNGSLGFVKKSLHSLKSRLDYITISGHEAKSSWAIKV